MSPALPALLALSLALAAAAHAQTVGMLGRVEEVVLPGPELQAVPPEDDSPLVLRVEAVYPHGDAHRYTLAYYGLEPGSYDLAEYLRLPDGSAATGLPPVEVEITASLPPDAIRPNPPTSDGPPAVGGYRWVLAASAAVWVAVLAFLVAAGRNRRAAGAADAVAHPPTTAERLRPLVEKARTGHLTSDEQAHLERLVLAFWRRRLPESGDAAESIRRLRDHPEAGELIRTLEEWLHRPGGSAREADMATLLAPYTVGP